MQLLKGDLPEASAEFWTEAYPVLRANALTPWVYAHYNPPADIGREYKADYEFSALSMRDHWASGLADIRRTLAHPDWLAPPSPLQTTVTHDVHRVSKGNGKR